MSWVKLVLEEVVHPQEKHSLSLDDLASTDLKDAQSIADVIKSVIYLLIQLFLKGCITKNVALHKTWNTSQKRVKCFMFLRGATFFKEVWNVFVNFELFWEMQHNVWCSHFVLSSIGFVCCLLCLLWWFIQCFGRHSNIYLITSYKGHHLCDQWDGTEAIII